MESYGLGSATAIAPTNFRPDTLTNQTLGRMKHLGVHRRRLVLPDLI